MIHHTAIIGKSVKLGSNVKVGPYVFIDGNVTIGDNTEIFASSSITGNTTIGENNKIFSFCSIGSIPQDLKYSGEETYVKIGNSNTFREYCTVNSGTKGGGKNTVIGNDSLFMTAVHIAHDCIVGNNVVMANQATLGGHVIVEDNAVIGGLSAIHQFCRIGELSMIGGMSAVENDVFPFALAIGNRAKITGLNLIGLKRANYEKSDIQYVNNFIKNIFSSNESIQSEISNFKDNDNILINKISSFISIKSSRGLCRYEKK
tara:strand:- start:234 stop:1013 length:780 start_codon:yes stop_codon:yes gene_type:complete